MQPSLKMKCQAFLHHSTPGGLHGQGITGTTVEVIKNGLPINAFYTKRFLGFDNSGFAIYEDDGYTLYYVGNPNPKALLGITLSAAYKKLMFYRQYERCFWPYDLQ